MAIQSRCWRRDLICMHCFAVRYTANGVGRAPVERDSVDIAWDRNVDRRRSPTRGSVESELGRCVGQNDEGYTANTRRSNAMFVSVGHERQVPASWFSISAFVRWRSQ